MDPNLPSWWN